MFSFQNWTIILKIKKGKASVVKNSIFLLNIFLVVYTRFEFLLYFFLSDSVCENSTFEREKQTGNLDKEISKEISKGTRNCNS